MNDFVADSEEESEAEELPSISRGYKPMWEKLLVNVVGLALPERSSEDLFQITNGNAQVPIPKVNGKHNKHARHVSLKAEGELLSQGNGVARMLQANIPMYKEALPSLESWQASKVTSWHNIEGHSILWYSVVSIDRKG